MAQASDLPSGNFIPGKHRGQQQVDDVRLDRPETAGRRQNRNIAFVAEHQQRAGIDRRKETLQISACAHESAANCIIGAGGRGRRCDQDRSRLEVRVGCQQRATTCSSSSTTAMEKPSRARNPSSRALTVGSNKLRARSPCTGSV